MTEQNKENENALGKVLREQEEDKNKRLDKIVAMQRDLFFKKIKYNILFVTISFVATIIMISIGMPLWIGVLFFFGLFFGLKHIYFNKLVINRYNKHVKNLYKKENRK